MSGLGQLAEESGASDLFVFHRIADDRFVNIDGHGRGSGWAGNVALDAISEPFLATVVDHGYARADHGGVPARLFGPYWTPEASAIRLGDTVVVISGAGTSELTEAELRGIAERAAAAVSDVPVAKRLADDLEATQAALRAASLRPTSLAEAGRQLATVAAEALSCEFGALLLLGDEPRLFLGDAGWRPPASDDEVASAILAVRGLVTSGVSVEQDLVSSPYAYPPLSAADGLVARLTAPVGSAEAPVAMLMVAHTGSAPRGFTSLCQTVATKVAATAPTVLGPFLGSDQASGPGSGSSGGPTG